MRAGQMDGYHYQVSGLELQSPSPCPLWAEAREPESHPGPRKRRGYSEGQEAGDGALAISALTLSSLAPGTPNLLEFPLHRPSSIPSGQSGRGTLCPPRTPGSFHLILSSCSPHPTMPLAALLGLAGPSSLDLPALDYRPQGRGEVGGGWDAGVSRAQGGQCRGKEPAGSPWTAWRTCWQEPSSVSHQPHQTHCLLLARPLLPGPVEQGALAQGTSEGQALPGKEGEADDACRCLAVPARLGQPVGSQG